MKYIHRLISEDSDKDIKEMIIRINEVFGLDISYVKASKLVSWKYHHNNSLINSDKLIEILGGKIVKKSNKR